jgi:hypothetical protein
VLSNAECMYHQIVPQRVILRTITACTSPMASRDGYTLEYHRKLRHAC